MTIWTELHVLNTRFFYYGVVSAETAFRRAFESVSKERALNKRDLINALSAGNFKVEVNRV